jgi:uncharacterized protein (DUF849 family)
LHSILLPKVGSTNNPSSIFGKLNKIVTHCMFTDCLQHKNSENRTRILNRTKFFSTLPASPNVRECNMNMLIINVALTGMVDYSKFLIDRQVLAAPLYFNLFLGSLGTLSATPFILATMIQSLPDGASWGAAGIGRFQFFVNSMAITMGRHVRVGLEDNLYMDTEKKVPASNPALVERIVRLTEAAGREIATPTDARRLIGLPG